MYVWLYMYVVFEFTGSGNIYIENLVFQCDGVAWFGVTIYNRTSFQIGKPQTTVCRLLPTRPPRLFPLTEHPYILERSDRHYHTTTIVNNDRNIQRR